MYQSAAELYLMAMMGSLAGVLSCYVHYPSSDYAVQSKYPSSP